MASTLHETESLGTLYLMEDICQLHYLAWRLLIKDSLENVSSVPPLLIIVFPLLILSVAVRLTLPVQWFYSLAIVQGLYLGPRELSLLLSLFYSNRLDNSGDIEVALLPSMLTWEAEEFGLEKEKERERKEERTKERKRYVVDVQGGVGIWAREWILSNTLFHLFLRSSQIPSPEFLETIQQYLNN